MANEATSGLKPSFEEEFPNNGVNWTPEQEGYFDQGILNGVQAAVRSRVAPVPKTRVTVEKATPSLDGKPAPETSAQPQEVDETRAQAEAAAKVHGGKPDDFDWRYQ